MPSENSAFQVAAGGIELYGETRGESRGEIQGESPRVVMLHGHGGDLHSWDALWQHLPADTPALRYDLRGFGRSGWDAHTPYDHADDLLAVLDARGIARVDLVGLSLGGSVALNFALRHPQRVASLVLVSPGMVAWDWTAEWRERWREIVALASAGDMDGARERWWQHPLFAPARACAAAPQLRAQIQAYSGVHWLGDPHVRALPDIERVHQLAVPTLLLNGALDLPDFQLIGDVIAASAPAVQRRVFDGCGHMLLLEAAEESADTIAGFLAAR
ncbi:alpha/beta hydrolase [Mangrovimicrobium sediminis]|uniref:Alpha/beta hydrolase n=1 Tax=Mangrovimicrobium sediminis TaxID=2562682 RepID=A0A4Z0M9Z4_9GAMM|nr:alpha/beta hydrolase [Haliea sp. SAOS-164]TGD76226.1 alpha/beta hydrolase [Haliea sp. SAOS-164]